MNQPLLYDAIDDGQLGRTGTEPVSNSTMTTPAATVKPVTVWKPVILRVVLGGLALLGLAGVGAASMLAGIDGAHANPPQAASNHTPVNVPAVASASGAPVAQPGSSGDAAPTAGSPGSPVVAAPAACNVGRTPDGKVILNTATVADLRTLPGIGEKRAQAIMSLRDKLKKFHRVQELRRVRGIGAKTLQRLAPKLLIDPPAGSCSS